MNTQSVPRHARGFSVLNLICNLVVIIVIAFAVLATAVGLQSDEPTDDDRAPDTRLTPIAYGRDCGTLDWQQAFRLKFAAPDVSLAVRAASYWNASGLILEPGVKYRFTVGKDDTWLDWTRNTDVHGWEPDGLIGLFNSFKRVPSQPYFKMIGATFNHCVDGLPCANVFPMDFKENGSDTLTFELDNRHEGELCVFANDLPMMYWNNTGRITLTVHRVRIE